MSLSILDKDLMEPPAAVSGTSPVDHETRELLPLDGPWRFRTDANAAWRVAQVPGCWESEFQDLRGWAGSAVYERTVVAPDSFRGKRMLLKLDAADYFAEAWVNGSLVGKHEGGYTPFAFDVTDTLKPGTENTVTIRVTDCTPEEDVPLPDGSGVLAFAEIPHGKQSWYTPISGIWQSVWLEARPFVSLESVAVTTDVDSGRARIRIRLSDVAAQSEGWSVLLEVTPPQGASSGEPVEIHIQPERKEAEAGLEIPHAALWSPDHPSLYDLRASLRQDGRTVDVVHTRFGMRKIETQDGHVYLNGEPCFIMGALDQAFYPRTIYTRPSRDYLRDQFLKAKELGLNLVRCHIKAPSTDYLDLCDELGLLVWYEVPNGSLLTTQMRERLRNTLVDMHARDANHPSIVILSLMNESWGIDLAETEQREWLRDTYHWAKQIAPDKLIVDNSACIPNFHVVSDLDDYHVYYNIPDQAKEFAEWVQSFADRNAGSYSGFGDATRQRCEPLLVSEFGNWGLPHYDRIVEAEGEVPWWFETGEGITRPAGVLGRFEKQKLGRAYKDYNGLADASQEQEWIALKFQIEEMRRRREVAGCVITELTDINWEVNGLLDFGRNPKIFHDRFKHLAQQDLLIPRPDRHAYWSGERVSVAVQLSRFSSRNPMGGRLTWRVGESTGSAQVGEAPRGQTTSLGAILFEVPSADKPVKLPLEIRLSNREGDELSLTQEPLVFAPQSLRTWGAGRSAWIHDSMRLVPELRDRMEAAGFRVLEQPKPDSLAVVTQWDTEANEFVQAGGRAILVALHPKSLQIASGLGLRLQDRALYNWWGDWCSSQTWFVPSAFPYLPDAQKLGFEYQEVIPQRVLAGATPDTTLAGIFVGWLRNPGAFVVRLPVGRGKLVVTTFDPLTSFHTDPISTLLLACLAEQVR